MPNTKISALTSATTPLDGTEVLPIVQSSTTKKVANNDLRPKQIQSNATSGVLQVVGPAAASTRVMTTPDANFTVARTDAANSFTGDQTLSTGNLIQGTAAKGINFTANTSAAGMTSRLLNWYEEGTWTPTVTASTGTITNVVTNGTYTRIGRQVTIYARIEINNNGTGAGDLRVTGMPYAAADAEMFNCAGREDRTVGFAWAASAVSATEIRMTKYDGTYPGGTLYEFSLICTYFA